MLKEKIKNIKAIHLLCALTIILFIVCVILFIQNYKINRTVKNIYGTGFNGNIQNRQFTREYDKLIRDYERKVDELMELQDSLIERDIFDDFYGNGCMNRHRRHWDYYNYDMRRHQDRIDRQRSNRNVDNNYTRDNRTFSYNSKIERNKDNFTLKVRIPRIFTLEDVKIDFKNRNLIVKIEKENEIKDKNEERRNYNSFFESFLVPETKAKLENIKVSLDKDNGNELTVIVPII